MRKSFFFLLLLGVIICGCINTPETEVSDLVGITATLPEIGPFTKSTFLIDNSGVHVIWAERDTIGIIPSLGDQVFFPIESGAGTNEANFNGGGWGLKDDKTYSAYYPFSSMYYSAPHDAIHLTYWEQRQNGNNSGAHLGQFDYLASGASSPIGNYLRLNFVRIGSILCFRLTVPQPGIYRVAYVESDAGWVLDADLDVTQPVPLTMPSSTSSKMWLFLDNIETTSENEILTLYMMAYPVNLMGHSLRLVLLGDGVSCSTSLTPKNLEAGKPYMFTSGVMETGIQFADDLVRDICVQYWDTDGNGLIDMQEAASVSSIGTLFSGLGITSFDEFQYFTSVTTIEPNAFEGCSRLVSMIPPSSITGTIGSNAFRRCISLRRFVVPEGVTRIEDDAFNSCYSLRDLVLPAGLQYVGSGAFSGTAIVSINLPDGVVAGPYRLFASCSALQNVNIPSGWTEIGDDFFSGCSSLQSIVVPEGITRIGDRCFNGCTSLASVSLPSSLLMLNQNAFHNCSSLTSIVIPSGVKAIYNGTFAVCTSLTDVSLPEGLVSIGEYGEEGAFASCRSLQTIILPSSLTFIGPYTFFDTAINQIVIPDGVTLIGKGAFERSSLEDITLPADLRLIDEGVFTHTNLTSLTVPESVIMIKPNILPLSITNIHLKSTVPPVLTNLSTIPDNDCPIYVPSASVSVYKEALIWSNYSSRIQASSDSGGNNPDPGGWRSN